MVVNLVLRFAWTLTLSPNVLDDLLYKILITTSLGIIETFRRSIWNLIRVELENLKYESEYSSIDGFSLPFEVEVNFKD